MSRDWQNGLFSCFDAGSDCFIGCCCPCFTYGKTNYRLKNEHDVTMSNYSSFNGPCVIFCLAAQFTGGIGACIMQMLQRAELRSRAGIKGSTAGDCGISWCCHCCSLIQDVSESRDLLEKKGQYAAMAAPVQPQVQQPMAYGQPEQVHPAHQQGIHQHPGQDPHVHKAQ